MLQLHFSVDLPLNATLLRMMGVPVPANFNQETSLQGQPNSAGAGGAFAQPAPQPNFSAAPSAPAGQAPGAHVYPGNVPPAQQPTSTPSSASNQPGLNQQFPQQAPQQPNQGVQPGPAPQQGVPPGMHQHGGFVVTLPTGQQVFIPEAVLMQQLGAMGIGMPMFGPGMSGLSEEQYQQLLNQLFNAHRTQGPPPTSEAFLNSIPKVKIEQSHVDNKVECSICKDEFARDDTVASLPCGHLYHEECVVPWLKEHNTYVPAHLFVVFFSLSFCVFFFFLFVCFVFCVFWFAVVYLSLCLFRCPYCRHQLPAVSDDEQRRRREAEEARQREQMRREREQREAAERERRRQQQEAYNRQRQRMLAAQVLHQTRQNQMQREAEQERQRRMLESVLWATRMNQQQRESRRSESSTSSQTPSSPNLRNSAPARSQTPPAASSRNLDDDRMDVDPPERSPLSASSSSSFSSPSSAASSTASTHVQHDHSNSRCALGRLFGDCVIDEESPAFVTLTCGHEFHESCLESHLRVSGEVHSSNFRCPSCLRSATKLAQTDVD